MSLKTLFHRHKVKAILFFFIALGVIALLMVTHNSILPINASKTSVNLSDQGFDPAEITIKKGTLVTFTTTRKDPFWPASNLHPTHLIYPEFDPKRPIEPGQSWQFRFDKVGKWNYHDHLYPNYTGTITVVDGNSTQAKIDLNITQCESLSDIGKKQQCWDEQLDRTVKQQGLDAAFQLFTQLYDTDPSVPKGCHGWAHILGRAAYQLYKTKKEVVLKKETSYCGYGFFHGFIEKLLQDSGDIKATHDFCIHAADQLKDSAPGVYGQCIHGIGHGAVGVDDPKIWGNFQAMVDKGLHTCEAALNQGELQGCYDGSFNAMQQNALHGDYQLSVDWNDLFKICRAQVKDGYKDSCYYEFTGLISQKTNHDFKKASDILLGEIRGQSFAPRIFTKMSADFFQDDIAKNDYTKNLMDCRALPDDDLRDACTLGIFIGFIAHGEPGRQYVKGLTFCRQPILTDKERDTCYQHILGQTVKKGSPECASVDEKYRLFCNG